MNLVDFMKSSGSEMILVPGIGKMRIDQAKKKVQAMVEDLSSRIDDLIWNPKADPAGWSSVDYLVKRGTIEAYLNAIVEFEKSKQNG